MFFSVIVPVYNVEAFLPRCLDSILSQTLQEIEVICVDAGSTDPGPYYLGSGIGFVKPLQVKRDLSLVLKRALERKIPFIIGSAGGSGAKPHVDSTLEIIAEIAEEIAQQQELGKGGAEDDEKHHAAAQRTHLQRRDSRAHDPPKGCAGPKTRDCNESGYQRLQQSIFPPWLFLDEPTPHSYP